MNSEDRRKVINKINDCLKENLWIDFEMCKMNEGNIVFSGMLDELDDEIIEISIIQPFMCSCELCFTYDEGEFISLIQGESADETVAYVDAEGKVTCVSEGTTLLTAV